MEVVEKTRRLRYTCRFTTPSYIAPLYCAVLHALRARTRACDVTQLPVGKAAFLVPGLRKGDDINEGMKKEEKKVKEQEPFTCTRC